ncbi:glycosyltransferase family 4 protein [Paludibaculum fermentans]|uniref:Glycosyltransferase family 4 protein n=1 Tax=Paludibaculum fermentans TaxID=1473598 RepID=A0A7S7NQ67_PALFE|nr:glycosyltransferase family 1 protein [Paludibaculum fermentans]QOY87746.1 glycosyltransferase family 4 protein [Paludibaculum fermentans]
MRIGVNALYLIPGGVGGTEIYLRRLLEAMERISQHEIVVFTNRETGPMGRVCVELPVTATSRPGRILYEQLRLPGVLRRARIDVVLNPGFTAPLLSGLPQVTVFHDLQHKRHPEFFRWFDLPFWRLLLWASAHKSRRLIAVSEATRDDLLKFYALDPRTISVVHHGVEPEFFELAARREDGGYLLCASTTHPHKNHDRLLRVFQRLVQEQPGWKLVLTGVKGFVTGEVEGLVRELGLEASVELKGWVPRAELYELFRRATGFIYPSRFEGFGMPVLEAMAAGLPVACGAIEPLKSLTGGAALLFDPESDEAMLEAMRKLVRGEAPKDGPLRAAPFTWQRAAELTLAAIEDSLRGGSSRRS